VFRGEVHCPGNPAPRGQRLGCECLNDGNLLHDTPLDGIRLTRNRMSEISLLQRQHKGRCMCENSVREYSVHAASNNTFGRVLASARNHHVVVDGPVQKGSPGEALTPVAIFIAGVATVVWN